MSAIDKTYVKTFEEYKEVLDWAKIVGNFQLTYRPVDWDPDRAGTFTVNLFDWIAYPNMTEDWWNTDLKQWLDCHPGQKEKDFPGHLLWNTPAELDEWLMLNCPLEVIQSRLNEQYDSEYRQAVKDGKIVKYLDSLKEKCKKITEQYIKEKLQASKNKNKLNED